MIPNEPQCYQMNLYGLKKRSNMVTWNFYKIVWRNENGKSYYNIK